MPFLLVRHKAEDHAKWKRVFDESDGMLWASGCTEARIFRNADDPQEVLVLGEWDELAKARQFTQAQSGEMEDTCSAPVLLASLTEYSWKRSSSFPRDRERRPQPARAQPGHAFTCPGCGKRMAQARAT